MTELVTFLRGAGGDTTTIEVKAAGGGLSPSVGSSLSALSNLPGGGTLVLGLDEKVGFSPVGIPDPNGLMQSLSQVARNCNPPVNLDFTVDATFEGVPIVVARVAETDRSAKPCRAPNRRAYLRGYDGDFELSEVEEQGFLAQRTQPTFDKQPVDGATRNDLDPELVDSWVATATERDPTGLGRFAPEEMLRRGGVVTSRDVPTIAGVLALGLHPQQWFPRYVIQMTAAPSQGAPAGARARNTVVLSGPIPRILDAALDWALRTFDTYVAADSETGQVRDVTEYPLAAIRELLSNALIHRDLDQWSQGQAIEVRLLPDRFVIANPGGLYGITVDRLGDDHVTSARNGQLVSICQHVRLPGGDRVVEALASGIPIIREAADAAGMPQPMFSDTGLRFTAILRRTTTTPSKPDLTATQEALLRELGRGPATATELAEGTGRKEPTVRKALRALRDRKLVDLDGGPGKHTTYRRT
ncbi:MAG: transcriptional regulator [Acidimicrobiia bacterium]|nr:transcriptional regulator [Acidimicrobiia bacterium]